MADERDEPLCRCSHMAVKHFEDGCCGEYDCFCTEYRYDRDRARERKLAELAREMAERIRPAHDGGPCLRVLSSDLDYWLRRYEEALK